ncbi:MAG: shikimate kinase [Dysgonomonas sp.]
MERIFLIGYMGVGKTTLGKGLAKTLNYEFIDMDQYIQSRYLKTIAQLFDEFGEEGFRKIENKILEEVSDIEDVVISTGGGTPCFYNNMERMNQKGKTVYLKADPHILTQRLIHCKDKRPLLKDKTDEELFEFVQTNLEKREPYYSQAKYIFDPDDLVSRDELDKYIDALIKLLK